MSKKLSLVFLLLLFCATITTAQQNTALIQPGVYMGYHLDSGHPDWGYYCLKKDSTFLLVGTFNDSLITHVAKGQWYVKDGNTLVMTYDVCPIKSLPEIQVSYTASNVQGFDSIRLAFTVLDSKRDTIPATFVYLDGKQYFQQTKFAGGSAENTMFQKAIILSKNAMPQKIVISPLDNMLPFFYETTIRPLEGFNVHQITVSSLHNNASQFFQPLKDGEAKAMSFQKRYSSGNAAKQIHFSGFILEHKDMTKTKLASLLMDAIQKQADYKDYFQWALANL